MRDFLRQFLLYSRSERRAVVALVVLIVAVLIIPRVHRFYSNKPVVTIGDSSLSKEFSLNSADPDSLSIDSDEHLFTFDPNTIGADDWIRLGLSDKQAAVIEKYKSRGGKFRKPDDLRKIYVLSDEMKNKLVPYVRIKYSDQDSDKAATAPMFTIEVNTADSSAFESLDGIGPYRASRIIRYRTALGGFYSIDQVAETPRLPDSVFQMIKPHLRIKPTKVVQIDINEADFETLKKHPYIRTKIARAIIDWRNFNGRFDSLEQLKAIKPITDNVYLKITPYLRLTE